MSWIVNLAQVLPEPTGPDAPPEVVMRVTQVSNFAWFTALACSSCASAGFPREPVK